MKNKLSGIFLLFLLILGCLFLVWNFSERKPVSSAEVKTSPISQPSADRSLALQGFSSAKEPSLSISTKNFLNGKAFTLSADAPTYNGPAKNLIDSLLPASKAGNASATYQIYLRVASCKQALSEHSDSDLEAYKKAGLESNYLNSRETALEQCSSIVNDSDIWDSNWLEKAADQGSLEAQLLYPVDVNSTLGSSQDMLSDPEKVATYRNKAMNYLKAAASSGSVDALFSLSNAYDSGVLAKKNPVASYAYDLALQRVNPSYLADSTNQVKRSQLSTAQIRESEELSSLIYNQCCKK